MTHPFFNDKFQSMEVFATTFLSTVCISASANDIFLNTKHHMLLPPTLFCSLMTDFQEISYTMTGNEIEETVLKVLDKRCIKDVIYVTIFLIIFFAGLCDARVG